MASSWNTKQAPCAAFTLICIYAGQSIHAKQFSHVLIVVLRLDRSCLLVIHHHDMSTMGRGADAMSPPTQVRISTHQV